MASRPGSGRTARVLVGSAVGVLALAGAVATAAAALSVIVARTVIIPPSRRKDDIQILALDQADSTIVLSYSLDPNQPGDQFLFNLLIAPVAITVNLVASLPGAAKALVTGRIHSRVPATILIAIGAFIPTLTDSLNRFGSTELFQLGKFLGVVFLFLGFLVSIEVFHEIRIPFTSIRLARPRREATVTPDIAAEPPAEGATAR